MSAKLKHPIETIYIRTWVESGAYCLVVSVRVAAEMRDQQVDLVDVNHVLLNGQVVSSDMIDMKGLWSVRGKTVDDVTLEIEIAVVSAECEVELLRVMAVRRRGR